MPTEGRPLLAGDHTAWSRSYARTLRDRTIEHQPTQIAGNKPIAVGHGFSTIAWIPEAQGSWALPLRHERITSFETPLSRAAFQLKQVCKHMPVRPIVTYDSEYGNASFVKQTAGVEADLLLRLRPNMCLWGAPPPYSGKGRPKVHGHKFKLADASTWGEPTATLEFENPQWGTVQIQRACWVTLPPSCHSSPASPTDYRFWQATSQALPQADMAGERWVSQCRLWSIHCDATCGDSPLTIGIDLRSKGYIGHYLTLVQLRWQNVGVTSCHCSIGSCG